MAVCLLFVKIQALFGSIRAPDKEYSKFFDSFSSLSLDKAEDVPLMIEESPPVAENGRLLLLSPDEITTRSLWDKLQVPLSILLLYRLQRVSRGWQNFVGSMQEWAALEFTRVDTPCYERFAS